MNSIIELNPATYQPHFIHGEGRRWAETNCYADVLIELIHALGFEPAAALAFTISIDFEVDQWTFFKFQHRDLLDMYGMHVEELNPWVSLAGHVEEQVNAGRPVLIEVDSYFLPDTAGTAYQSEHVKSTIAVNEIDVENSHMGYFHGQGYYHLDGDEFRQIFQLDGLVHDRMLPPYIELIKLRQHELGCRSDELVSLSIESLRRQLALLPSTNPFLSFQKRFEKDLIWLRREPIETFHGYSFATLRQYGACYELAATYLQWLQDKGESGLAESIDAFHSISESAKLLQFKLARSISRQKDLDVSTLDQMAQTWQAATGSLTSKYT